MHIVPFCMYMGVFVTRMSINERGDSIKNFLLTFVANTFSKIDFTSKPIEYTLKGIPVFGCHGLVTNDI